jgi:hypothetical protein
MLAFYACFSILCYFIYDGCIFCRKCIRCNAKDANARTKRWLYLFFKALASTMPGLSYKGFYYVSFTIGSIAFIYDGKGKGSDTEREFPRCTFLMPNKKEFKKVTPFGVRDSL